MLHEHESHSGLNHLTPSQDSRLPHQMLTTLMSRLSATRLRPLLAQNHPMKMPLLPPSCLSLTAALVSQHVCTSGSAGACYTAEDAATFHTLSLNCIHLIFEHHK